MSNYWHNTILGIYNPADRWMGLDFRNLFLDPQSAKLTHLHELTHSVLSRTTDFGQATEVIYQLLPQINKISPEDKKRIKKSLMEAQHFTQEGSACIMELLRLRRQFGRLYALNWAKKHLTPKYQKIVEKFYFILKFSQKNRNFFTMRIPHLAMHTGIRRAIVQNNLLSNTEEFINYLQHEDNNPDYRLQNLIKVLQNRSDVSNKSPEEICQLSGIEFIGDVTKQDAADFLNYMHNLANTGTHVDVNQIRDEKNIDAISEANENIIIGNINLNLAENGIVLWKRDDLLHYKDVIKTVFISRMNDDDMENKPLIKQLIGTNLEAGLAAFLKTGEKYIFCSDAQNISNLIKNDFLDCSLIVKWGLFKPGENELNLFPNSRKPDVVIYNNIRNLDDNFKDWFKKGNKAEYLYIGVSKGHPFQILLIKDNDGVIHFVNTFNRPANDFLRRYSSSLIKMPPEEFLNETRHYNNTLHVWGGMQYEVDWYKTMLDGTTIYYR